MQDILPPLHSFVTSLQPVCRIAEFSFALILVEWECLCCHWTAVQQNLSATPLGGRQETELQEKR